MYATNETLLTLGDALVNLPTLLAGLPEDLYFSLDSVSHLELRFAAHSNADLRRITDALPDACWTPEYHPRLNWYEYKADIRGVAVKVFGILEAPAHSAETLLNA